MSTIFTQFHSRVPRAATLIFLFCLCAFMIFVVTDRQKMLYYLPDSRFGLTNKTQSPRLKLTQMRNPIWKHSNSSKIDSSNSIKLTSYMTSSNSSSRYSSVDVSKIDMMSLMEKIQLKRKLLAKNSSSTRDQNEYEVDNFNNSYPPSQRERIERIKSTCSDRELFKDSIYQGKNSTIYYYSTKYDFLYCKVPKSGSTFWTQAFHVLEDGVSASERIFGQKRSKIHGSTNRYSVNINRANQSKSLSILVSRDPYSRLYSAYIDKSYLPLSFHINFAIRKYQQNGTIGSRLCPVDVTFQEFLDYIISQAMVGRTLNRHWLPICNLCRPCDVNAYILVKQESFSNDVEEALRAFEVGEKKFDVIMSALMEHRVEATIPGIIETVYDRARINKVRLCMDGKSLALRLWRSFKIQGYLNKDVQFPTDVFLSPDQYNDTNYVTDVILDSIQRNKMTSSEMKHQRHQALVDAYKEIKEETIEGIKELYKIDFEMFGYSKDPPTIT